VQAHKVQETMQGNSKVDSVLI